MQHWAWLAYCAVALPFAASAAEPRKGDFLQDYITCEHWMKRAAGDDLREQINQWAVDALRQHSPTRLSQFDDSEILSVVERFCQAQPSHSLTVATFLAGQRLPD